MSDPAFHHRLHAEVEELLKPETIRARAIEILASAQSGGTAFEIHLERLPEVTRLVLETIRANYPTLEIPFHSRRRHFQAGKVDRVSSLNTALAQHSPAERGRAWMDLTVISVFLDAGAGPNWRYTEQTTGQTFSRSEGLAVASLRMFESGLFSSAPNKPFQADVDALRNLSLAQLSQGFQVSSSNPMVGLEGRLNLMHRLADSLDFSQIKRPSGLIDILNSSQDFFTQDRTVPLAKILRLVLLAFQKMWPPRFEHRGVSFGDTWLYRGRIVPFHKLSQWLTYSLVEPLTETGLRISGLDALTGLPEYRNGGLLLDAGLIAPRDPQSLLSPKDVGSDWVIEWRALTVALLDEIAVHVRESLHKSEKELPLVCVLEGGTWWAGRSLAQELRPKTGGPPVDILSDGTVF